MRRARARRVQPAADRCDRRRHRAGRDGDARRSGRGWPRCWVARLAARRAERPGCAGRAARPLLEQAVFNRHHAEHEMLRYLKRLEDKDVALNRSMIPLGSCTMKLNATAEMIPITLPGFADMHPFAPAEQTVGLHDADRRGWRDWLKAITGFAAVSLQPNAGIAGRICRAAGDPRLARGARRGASRCLPDPVQRARHQSGERGDGGAAGGGGRLRPRRQRRSRRSAREGGAASRIGWRR